MHRLRRRSAEADSIGRRIAHHSQFVEIRKWALDGRREVAPLGQFTKICCLTGSLSAVERRACAGEIFLVPALSAEPATKIARIPNKSVAGDDSAIRRCVSKEDQ
jgi:hypothetical protein